MALLVAGDQNIVLVFALFTDPAMRGDAVAILPVVIPLAFVLKAVRPLRDAEAAAFIVLPFTHVRLGDAGIQLFVL